MERSFVSLKENVANPAQSRTRTTSASSIATPSIQEAPSFSMPITRLPLGHSAKALPLRSCWHVSRNRGQVPAHRLQLHQQTLVPIYLQLHASAVSAAISAALACHVSRRTSGSDPVRKRRATANRILTVLKVAVNHSWKSGHVASTTLGAARSHSGGRNSARALSLRG
jgi:hypothetical protein